MNGIELHNPARRNFVFGLASICLGTKTAKAMNLAIEGKDILEELRGCQKMEELKAYLDQVTDGGKRNIFIHKASKELVDEINAKKGGYDFVFSDTYKYQIIVDSDKQTVVIIPRGSIVYYSGSRGTNGSDF